ACDEFTLTRTATAAPAATIHFEGIRIMPTPLFRRQQTPLGITSAKPFMVQTIRQAIGACLRAASPGKVGLWVGPAP
ncbi:MAG TPA: hypothetical protein VK526_00875, partial [Bradyrhizobium sp.]|nr:hypothetical protein [Bradyrhizobium sp.]